MAKTAPDALSDITHLPFKSILAADELKLCQNVNSVFRNCCGMLINQQLSCAAEDSMVLEPGGTTTRQRWRLHRSLPADGRLVVYLWARGEGDVDLWLYDGGGLNIGHKVVTVNAPLPAAFQFFTNWLALPATGYAGDFYDLEFETTKTAGASLQVRCISAYHEPTAAATVPAAEDDFRGLEDATSAPDLSLSVHRQRKINADLASILDTRRSQILAYAADPDLVWGGRVYPGGLYTVEQSKDIVIGMDWLQCPGVSEVTIGFRGIVESPGDSCTVTAWDHWLEDKVTSAAITESTYGTAVWRRITVPVKPFSYARTNKLYIRLDCGAGEGIALCNLSAWEAL